MIRIIKFLNTTACRFPLTVHIAPCVSAERSVHISIETNLLFMVVALNINPCQNIIPHTLLILHYSLIVPAKGSTYLLLQILRSICYAHERDPGSCFHHSRRRCIKLNPHTCIRNPVSHKMISSNLLTILPGTHTLYRLIKLDNKMQFVLLVSIITPNMRTRRYLMRITLNSVVTHPLNIHPKQMIIILSLHMQINH
jgi:hypothetical protein